MDFCCVITCHGPKSGLSHRLKKSMNSEVWESLFLCVCVFKIPEDWKNELFPRGTCNSQNLTNKTLALGDQEYVNDSSVFFVRYKVIAKRTQQMTCKNIRDQQGSEFHFWNFESCQSLGKKDHFFSVS